MSTFSRRRILGGGSALLVGAGIERPAIAAPAARGSLRADVCVVGAGYAGLTAAYRLKQAGAKVVVLEARNRVGGRSLTAPLKGGGWIDLGGQWVGKGHDRFYALIREMGGETYPTPDVGLQLERDALNPGAFVRIKNETEGGDAGANLIKAGFDKVDALASSLDAEKPWAHPDAERLDAMTFAEWLVRNVENENARGMVGAEVGSIACASPEEISILEIAFLVRACKGLGRLFGTEGGAQQDRVIGGTQPIIQKVADRLGPVVRLGKPVRRIVWDDAGAVVHSDDLSVAARHVIVCTPPHLAGAIEYDPSPPTARVQVTQRWPQGLVIKVQMIYPEPYWRADELNGASLDDRSVVGETADSGVPEQYSKRGIMTGFIYAAQARRVAPLSPAERKKIVLDEMAQRFGPKALNPTDYHEMNWSTQQWTRGCFTGFLTPGATTLFRSAVRDPVGPLHWAGTETSTVWPSFIEGAIRSGERAVAEIKARS
jgi:monoamine oxidase